MRNDDRVIIDEIQRIPSLLNEVHRAIEEKGGLFEGFIAQLLKAYRELGRLDYDRLSYWPAGKNSLEVDFLMARGKELIAIEAKSGAAPDPSWFSGVKALKETGRLKRAVVVYLGERKFTHASGAEVLPLKTFLSQLSAL